MLQKLIPFLFVFSSLLGLGQSFVVQEIKVSGNKKTNDKVIFQELRFAVGDTFSSEEWEYTMERSTNNLLRTSLFTTVQIDTTRVTPKSITVEIAVTERWYLWPEFILENFDRNFSNWWQNKDFSRLSYGANLNWNNFNGNNQHMAFSFQWGFERKVGFQFKAPYLLKNPKIGLTAGFNYATYHEVNYTSENNKRVFHQNLDEIAEQKIEGNITLRYRFNDRFSLSVGYRVQHFKMDSFFIDQPQDFLPNNQSETFIGETYFKADYDLRDNINFPLVGPLYRLEVYNYGQGAQYAEQLNTWTTDITLEEHLRLSKRWFTGVQYKGHFTFGDQPPYAIQRGLGYENYVRGYELYIFDAQQYNLFKTYFKHQIISPHHFTWDWMPVDEFKNLFYAVYAGVFVDAAHTTDDLYGFKNALSNKWLTGYGLNLTLVGSYDFVLRTEYSFNLEGDNGYFVAFKKAF